MAAIKPLIDTEKLNTKFIDTAFKSRHHKYYVLYDSVADELIVKLVKPKTPTSIFHIDDYTAFIVELKTNRVVGFMFFEFTTEGLSTMTELNKVWESKNLANFFSEYKEFEHVPDTSPEYYVGFISKYASEKLQEALVN